MPSDPAAALRDTTELSVPGARGRRQEGPARRASRRAGAGHHRGIRPQPAVVSETRPASRPPPELIYPVHRRPPTLWPSAAAGTPVHSRVPCGGKAPPQPGTPARGKRAEGDRSRERAVTDEYSDQYPAQVTKASGPSVAWPHSACCGALLAGVWWRNAGPKRRFSHRLSSTSPRRAEVLILRRRHCTGAGTRLPWSSPANSRTTKDRARFNSSDMIAARA